MNLSSTRYYAVIFLTFFVSLFLPQFSAHAQSSTPLTTFPTFNGTVSAIGISGTTIYVGGSFTQATDAPANGGVTVTRNRLAAIDMTTGALLPWNPNANNNVGVLTVDGSTVYVGGGFTNVGGQMRNQIAALDAVTGAATAWNPGSGATAINAIAVSGTTVYVGGAFSNIGGQSRNNIAAIDAGTGLATAWNPNADADVTRIVISGGTIYVGGVFANIGGQARNRIAALDAATGSATLWNPNANNTVLSMALSGTTLYVGGNFTNIGGQVRNRIAALNTLVNTNNATLWNPSAIGSVESIAITGTTVYVSGTFTNCGSAARNNIGALDATVNTLNATAWNPNADAGVPSIAVSGSNVFVGGGFSTIGGSSRQRFAAFGPPTLNVAGNLPPFTPRPTTSPLMNTMNYGTPTGSPVKVPMNTAGVNSIDVTFSQSLAPWVFSNGTTSPNARDAMKVFGTTSRGYRSGTGFGGSGATLSFTTTASVTTSFNPGEQVWVTVTNAQSTGFAPTRPFVMGFRTAAGTGPVNFTSQPTGSPFATGNSPQGMALADFDGDGDLDMATANYTANTASILVNNGSGTYTPHPVAPTPVAGTSPYLLIAGDVDNDGDIDLAVANDGSGVTIMFNNGSGNFSTTTLVAGGDPTGLALADIDADGDLDLMTTNFTGNTVTTRLNNGSGGFGAATPYTTGGGPGAVGMGDIDNDGDLDMVVSANTGNRIDVFMNSGFGTFYAPATPNYATGTGPRSVNFADLNNDGFMDVVTVSGTSNNANVFLNNTAGGFAAAVNYATGTTPFPVRLGDIDGDGDLDMVVANNGSNNVTVRLNNGAGNFTTIASGSPFAAGGGSAPWGMELGDVDGDGDVDIAMTKNTGNLVVVLLNAPPMTVLGNLPPFTPRPTTTPLMNTVNYGTPTGSPVKVPMNTAGVNGIDITFSQNLAPWVFSNGTTSPTARDAMKVHGTTSRGYRSGVGFAGSGATLQFTTTASITSSFNPGEQVWVTVTNAQSTAGASTRPFVMGFRTRAGSGPAQFPAQTTLAAGTQPFAAATGDLDGDGDLDIVSVDFGTTNVRVYLNNGNGTYAANVPYTAATGLMSVSVGDLNNDGALDIVAGNNLNGIYVFLNQNLGTGTFAPAVFYTHGTGITSIGIADMDADGDMDLVLAIPNLNSIGVRLNNGAGVFGASTGYFIGASTGPNTIITADLDGDGDIDVAEANQLNPNVSVLMNNGVGTLGAVVNYAAPANPWGLTAGDIDGDGDIDLVSANQGANSVSVFVNSGTGTFARTDYTTGFTQPQGITLNDLDGDGDLDIAVSNATLAGTVGILLNSGGIFAAPINYATGPLPYAISSGDVDGDGDIDLVTPNRNGATVSVLFNTLPMNVLGNTPPFTPRPTTTPLMNTMNVGTPSGSPVKVPMNTVPTGISVTFSQNATAATFTDPTARNVMKVFGTTSRGYRSGQGFSGAGATMTFTTTANFNPGEQVWVSVTNAQSTGGAFTRPFVMGFRTRAGTGPANFSTQTTGSPFAVGTNPLSVAFGDVDGDGDLDVATANRGSNDVSVLLNNGSGIYTPAVGSPFAVGTSPRSVAFGDVDGDGDLDVATANFASNNASVLLNNGSGGYTAAVGSPFAVGTNPFSVAFGDVDGDGDMDVATANANSNNVSILLNNGSGTYTAAVGSPFAVGSLPLSVAFGDVDGDGDLDVATANRGSNNVSVLLNNGSGGYTAAVGSPFAAGTEPFSVAFGDLDGDGDLDMATANQISNNVSVLLNNGSGGYTNAVGSPFAVGTEPFSVAFGDLDGDGDLDVATANDASNNVSILLNNGSGGYTNAVGSPFSVLTEPSSVAFGDVDGDGDLDVATANFASNNFTVLLNAPPLAPMNVLGNLPPFTPRPTTTPLMNTMNYGTPTGSPMKVPMNTVPTGISVTFSQNATAATFTDPTARNVMKVHGTTSQGYRSGTGFSGAGATMTFTTTANFNPGEQVWVSVTNAQSTGGAFTRPFVMGFRAAAGAGSATFYPAHTLPKLDNNSFSATDVGDLDGDGDLDIVSTNTAGLAVHLQTGVNTGVFSLSTAFGWGAGSGAQARNIKLADVNNDGNLDAVAVNAVAPCALVVWVGNGAGGFGAAASYTFAGGSNTGSLSLADVDADGDLDAISGDFAANSLHVMLNNGSGAFTTAPGSPFAAGATLMTNTAVGDVDNDGDIDVCMVSATRLFVMLNNGVGRFASATGSPFAIGASNSMIALGDINGDGFLDAVFGDGATVHARLNNGSGTAWTASTGSPYAVGINARSLLADVDGNGRLDIVALGQAGSTPTHVLLNGGGLSPNFTPVVGSPFAREAGNIAAAAVPCTVGDMDGDGDLDIIYVTDTPANVTILKNGTQPLVSSIAPFRNGNTTMNNPNIAGVGAPVTVNFSTNITTNTYSVPPAQQLFQVHGSFTGSRTRSQGFSPNGAYSGGATAMTFTPSANFRPGELVSVSVSNASSSVTAPNNSVGIRTRPFVFDYRVAAGMGPANFSVPALGSPFGAGAAARSAAFGDVDGDGDLDIATANQTGTNVTVLANNGSGSYTAIAGSPFAVGGALRSLVFGDVDRDGDLDLVITRIGLASVVVLLNNGSGSFTTSAIGSPFTVGTSPWYVALGDVDGDGDLDLATANNGSNDVTLLLNNGVGTFTPAPGSPIALGSTGASGIDFGDVDGDGDLDFAVANNGSTNVAVLLNNGTGLYTPAAGSPFTVGTSPRSVTFGDLDGDGDLDIATTNQTSNDVTVLLNNGAGSYSPSPGSPFAAGTQPIFLAFGDVDGDGDLDLATANQSSNNLTVLLNNGAGTFAAAANSPFAAGTQPNSVAFGDVDGDGDLDLAAANNGSNNVTVLFNQVAPTKYYYQSGDAGLPGSWNSMPNGSGSSATSFNSPDTDFYVMGGGASTTATVNTSFTLGANVSLHVTTPSVLALNGGVTITNNGFLNVSGATVAGATLRLGGTAAIAGNAVTYWGTTATLEYSGAAARATSAIEFPAAMPGSVTMNNTGGVTLHANRQINGTFTMQSGSLDISGRTLQPNGVITFAAGTINGNATSALTITGSGNINGNALFGAGGIGTLTMNRAGATMTLGSPLDIANTGSLFLTQGYIRTTPTNILSILNTAPASVFAGSGTTSHIAGPLRRSLAAVGGIYDFPVGGGTPLTYIPLQVSYASAAGTASYEVEPFLAASGGTEAGVIGTGTLSTTEYWRTFLGGFALVNATLTFTRTIPALIGTSRIGEAATAGGVYQGINTNTLSTVAAPNISNTMVYTPLNPGTLFYAIGAAAAPPVVTAVSPTRNNPAVAPLTSPVNVTFSQTLTALGMRTWNGFTGRNLTAPTFAGNTATQTGMNTRPGERVMTTITATGTSSAAGFMTTPHVSSFMGRAGTGPATFTQTSLTPTPASVWGIKVGYFNNDTNLDVALSTDNPPMSSFRIFTGDGAGNFAPWYNATLSGGTPQGRGLAVADFNNDGRPDAAVGNILTGTVEVFINNAGATMNVGPVLPAFSVFDVTVGDFNGDGNIDIAATGYGAGQLFVYFGNGLGGFAAAPSSPYAIGTPNAAGISTDDFDNDGDMDIVVNTNVSLHIFANNGAGVFSQTNVPTTYTTLYGVLLTADFDNDGDIDILPTGLNPAGMTIYQNNGAGAFTGVSFAGNSPLILSMGDFNGDGLIDILNSVGSIPYFSQNINTAAGTLAFAPQRIIPNPANVSLGVAGDVDNDGDLDVIATAGTQFAFLRNAPYQNVVNNTFPFGIPPVTPTFNLMNAPVATTIVVPFTQNVTAATASAQAFKVWGGFTGLRTIGTYTTGVANATLTPSTPFRSGEQVFVSVTHAQSSLNVPTRPFVMGFRTRAGMGPATFQQVTIPTMLTGPRSIATGDFDGNGTLDFAATNGSSNNVTILISTGGGTYSASTVTVGANPQCVMPGDFDNDGDLDLAVADGANNVSLLRNTAGVFAAWGPVLVVGALPQAIAVGDYDADGDLDLATVNLTGNNISILLNTGAGAFAGAVNYALSGGSNPEFITTGDFDNDGDLDLATANYGTNTVSILMNSGFGTFALTGNFPVGTQPQFITAADLNGDGNLDLATANAGGGGINDISILVNSNVTPGTFAAVNYAVGAGTVAVMPGDFDGDGDLDLTVANGGNVSMMRNTGGVFALATNNVLGGQPFSLVTGDFDNDGDIDAAAVNFGPDNVAILLNQNSPTRAGFGNALTFNGTTQDVAATNPAFDISAGTLETWIRPTWVSGAPPANPCIMAIRDGIGNTRYSFHIMSNYSGLAIWNGSLAFFPYPFAQNQWYHIAVTLTGGAATLYVNGIQAGASIPYGVGPATGGQVHIGWAPVSGEPWQGDIDEVRLWNTALPQTTINTYKGLEIGTTHPNWSNLLGYWRFNEYGGTSAADASGNGNTATLVNAPTSTISLAPVSMIADPTFAVPTTVSLPATVAVGLPTITQIAVPAPVFGSVAPAAGNPVNYTPFIAIPSGAVDNFNYQASDGTTTSQATVSVRYRPQLTGNSFAVAGLPTVLTAPVLNGGTSPFTWSWTPATPELSSTSIQFPTFTGLTPQSYTVQVTDAHGFTASAPVNVTIVPGAFYYTNGDAALPSQWRSFYGNGSPAPSFTIPGTTFIVMGSTVFGSTIATTVNNMVIGTGVTVRIQAPSVLTIADGTTLTNFGTLIVEGNSSTGGTLRLLGTGSIAGNAPLYQSGLSVLQYSGTNVQRSSSPIEFPNVMPGTVVVDENVTVVLDDHKTLSSALVLGGLLDIRGRNVILQGRLDLRGAFISDGQSDLEIGTGGGTPAGITGALKIATNVMRNVTLNR
ncbi:MAG: VCBS repeat-containing protein, partial [Ignavibacteria bacterium]|nr:VCBS repeat-containing protein [Ignavibacteria bacterium]